MPPEDIGSWDSADLADHFQEHLPSMHPNALVELGRHLLDAFKHRGAEAETDGVNFDDVAAGSPAAISTLVDLAKNNPDVLNTAASNLVANPGRIGETSPSFVSEIVARVQKG